MKPARHLTFNWPKQKGPFHSGLQSVLNLVDIPEVAVGLDSTTALRQAIDRKLSLAKWALNVQVAPGQNVMRVTGMTGQAAIQVQTGNIARIGLDLLKLQYLRDVGTISHAFLIVPTKSSAESIGSNIANFEKVQGYLELFSTQLTTPIALIGIE